MHIVIYASGIPFDGDTVKERSLGGSESAAYYVAKELARRGNEVVIFTEGENGGIFDGVSYVHTGEKTQEFPLGKSWHFYCENTPHDINIVQRHPAAFIRPLRSKVNLFWAHDIALKRNKDPFMAGLWQTDAVMPVSNWFKNQITESWELNPEIVKPITNGVDYSLFDEFELKDNASVITDQKENITLLYSSRPERGLEHLVRPGGIMDRLKDVAPHIQLKICGYDHAVPSMEGLYGFLREQIELLPNCEHMGALTKSDLYKFMCTTADAWCYPTEFEEVSCITAMEAMAAGLTIMTTDTAALKETIGSYQNVIMFDAKDGVPEDKFVERLSTFNNKFRRRTNRPYTWERATDSICEVIEDCLDTRRDPDAIARHYLHNSDIVALDKLSQDHVVSDPVLSELDLYDFRHSVEAYNDHYSEGTERMYDGPDFVYEEGFENHPRFQAIASRIAELELEDGARIIDYGCAHGHFTNNLAKAFPQYRFVGVDVSPKAIAVAAAKAEEWDLTNVLFFEENWQGKDNTEWECDVLIVGEILEHVPDIGAFMQLCQDVVGLDTYTISTTPFGPWEANSYEKEYPTRYHLHHLERQDLRDMFGRMDGFEIVCLPAGGNATGELLGWYICSFRLGMKEFRPIDYSRKYQMTVPRQTVSFCAIARNAALDIPRLLKSVGPYVDEIIVGVDKTSTDDTAETIHNSARYLEKNRSPTCPVTVTMIDSPTEIGFDAARNETIKHAGMQWIMWADADEEFISGERMRKYLRNNQWRGYGIPQHHFSAEPTAVLSTDYPVRLFRNHEDVRFLGVVHEHPECRQLENEGVGFAYVLHELHFNHYGYKTENIRRERFQRNISLMARDREENPNRILGKFLWVRDLALMCRFELEQNGMVTTPQMRQQAESGLELWENTVDLHGKHKQTQRMIKDHLEFYDTLVNVVDHGFTFRMKMSSGIGVNAPELSQVPEISARFLNRRHLDKFLSVVIDSEVERYEERYL